MTTPEAPAANLVKIVIAAPMKSGSTYMGHVLGRYFGTGVVPEMLIDWYAEHNMLGWVGQLRNTSYCFNLHLYPHMSNLAIARHEGVAIVVVWRNLGDMLVSYDDHMLQHKHNPSMIFIHNHERFGALPPAARYHFMIDTVAPWYIGFYLRWRGKGVTIHPYEQMLLDQRGFFGRMVAELTGAPADEARLSQALAPPPGESDRYNVGRVGRSAAQFPDDVKRRLEDKIFTHPDRAQLEILLWELPWEVPRLERRSALDGKVVARASDGAAFFVSCGVAYPIAQLSWLLSRAGERRTPVAVDDAELAKLEVGELLV